MNRGYHFPEFDDLAAYRVRENMPPASYPPDPYVEYPDNSHTAARLDVDGQSIYGRNGTQIPVDIKVNAQSRTHAETHAFQQMKNKGYQSDTAVLYVDNKFCRPCERGGVGTLMRATGVKEVLAFTPQGTFLITAKQPSSAKPIALDSPKAQAILQHQQARRAQRNAAQTAAVKKAAPAPARRIPRPDRPRLGPPGAPGRGSQLGR